MERGLREWFSVPKIFILLFLLYGSIVASSFTIVYAAYRTTRYKVDRFVSPGRKPVFRHEDEETTRILDYLSGKNDLPREMKFRVAKNIIALRLEEEKLLVPENIWGMDEAELEKLCAPLKKRGFLSAVAGNGGGYGEDGNWFEKLVLPLPRYDEGLYQALWRAEIEVGSPKVHFRDGARKQCDRDVPADYEFSTNTACIGLPEARFSQFDLLGHFAAEAAHSKQNNDGFYRSYLMCLRDETLVWFRAWVEGTTYKDAYIILYDTPSTFEYEAHTIIEPELRKKIFERKRSPDD